MKIHRTLPLTLEDRMNFLHPTELIATDSLGWVTVSQEVDAEKCD